MARRTFRRMKRRRPRRTRMALSKRRRIYRSRRRARKNYMTKTLKCQRRFLPEFALVKMRYCHRNLIALNVGNQHYSQIAFRANNIFDPYRTGVGHNPYGYKQWQALYQHYIVMKSKITCKFEYVDNNYNQDQEAHAAVIVGMALLEDSSSQFDNYRTLSTSAKQEQPLTVWSTIGHPTSGKNTALLCYNYRAKKFWRTKVMSDAAQQGNMNGTSQPTKAAAWSIWMTNDVGGLTESDSIQVWTTVDYTVLLKRATVPGQSDFTTEELDLEDDLPAGTEPDAPPTPPDAPGSVQVDNIPGEVLDVYVTGSA